jgi:hypothetical protein
MPDLPGPVAAILAETPFNHLGQVATQYGCGNGWCCPDAVTYGDPTPVAARQAAAARPAILRELAEELEAREVPAEGKIWLIDARWLRARADEIEEATHG